MNSTLYEIGPNGLTEMKEKYTELQPGIVLHWQGNYDAHHCILDRRVSDYDGRISYLAYNMDNPDNNAHTHYIDAYSIKGPSDEVWHRQHYFLQDETVPPEKIEEYRADLARRIQEREAQEAESKSEADRLEAIGRELWPRLVGDCPAVIIAEHEKNTSDPMTDYFASVTTERVILAPSKHNRDLFPEMRKAAALLPETQHLGPGMGRFLPYVEIGQDFISNGSCYYKGSRSHWHQEIDKDEHYNNVEFTTRAEAEAYINEKGDPCTICFDGQDIPFAWNIDEREIEHREKYSMGKGYYLGHDSYSGWQVSKEGFYKGAPQREHYITLAKRHDHLEKPSKPAPTLTTPKTPAGTPATQDAPRVEYDRDWTWLYFAGKPSEETRANMKAAGGRFSAKRAAWYFTRHLEENEINNLLIDK